ncbi:MAG: 1-deoxy-D-xylulose-5-phosphate reductoisomerase [Defluviitaleaceae bacterium]|nr:1-deoxy-D-xylulose-5-phosphate reductoisomerase [Defluviitaleaceae bacterium]
MGIKIALLGATGSIGLQTLDVVRNCLPDAKIVAMSGYSNRELLAQLAEEFRPEIVWTPEQGEDALISCAAESGADVVVNALVGRAGLAPTLAAINAGKNIALANKETLVTAGELVMGLAREKGVRITPIDSEHSAVWQCMGDAQGAFQSPGVRSGCPGATDVSRLRENVPPLKYVSGVCSAPHARAVEKIILTASGGPFRTWPREKIAAATAADALKHPNWDMGAKITIDSATLMNKGLEYIEAMHLFGDVLRESASPGVPAQREALASPDAAGVRPAHGIEVVVHPQSIIHSMVQFCDGSVISQMGLPDMRLPILYALSAPHRVQNDFPRLNFLTCGDLTFEPPRSDDFPCLSLAIHAAEVGGTLPAVMNWLNEWAVGEFLRGKIGFYDISAIISRAFDAHEVKKIQSIDDIREAEAWADKMKHGFLSANGEKI